MERLQTSNFSVSNGNLKYPFGKSIFAVNFPLRFFRTTIANANTESLRSLHTLFDTYFDYMLAKFERNRAVRNVQKFVLFDKNYGNPTRVTRLKVASNMTDPTGMKHSVSNLKSLYKDSKKIILYRKTCSTIKENESHVGSLQHEF